MANWNDFGRFEEVIIKYMPIIGEGDTIASQVCTAVNKLIYKWFNDGDVYDNVTSGMTGWCNDLSSYANWLHKYIPVSRKILEKIFDMYNDDDEAYSDMLFELATVLLDVLHLENESHFEKIGSIYDCDGIFKFSDYPYDDDDYDDDYDEEDY